MALLFLGIGCGIYKLVERNLEQSVDAALIASAESLRSARKAISYRSPFTQSFLREFFGENYIRPYAQLVDLSGRVSAKTQNVRVSLPVTPNATARAERGLATIETIYRHNMPPLRQITLPVMHRDKFTGELIQVGAPLDATYRTLRSISFMLWVVLPVGLLVSIIVGYILMAWSLRPVAAVTRAASRLGSDDLAMRLPLPIAHDEIRDLSGTFNSMLDRLQDAFSRIKRFAGDVSHELRTPLAVLRGEAEFALRRERSAEDYRKSLEIIEREAINMTSIVEDLLLLARAQSKSVAMNWERIDLRDFIGIVCDSVRPVFEDRGVILSLENARSHLFYCVSGYLSLAIKNVLLNAAKHSPSGSEVVITTECKDGKLYIAITDRGEGIPAGSLPYIFDAFYRADTARNRAAGGTGIGLSLAQALVSLHDGKMLVESEVGVGSTFSIVIPDRQYNPKESARHLTKSDPSITPASLPVGIATIKST
jgi:heavy metal sensor kinase